MVKQFLPALVVLVTGSVLFSSCSTFRPLNFTSNRQVVQSPTSVTTRFIEDITVSPVVASPDKAESKKVSRESLTTRGLNVSEAPAVREESRDINQALADRGAAALNIESASAVQLKYAVLMNTEVENLPTSSLLNAVDEWYGVRYRTGGNSKSGVDCSGFTVAVYAAVYGFALPRVSRDQYRMSRKISTTELQEGDLVFFNTNGSGVSHVGVYLGNNKFIHASVSRGVMVSGLFEPYYIQRFIGAGRIDNKEVVASN